MLSGRTPNTECAVKKRKKSFLFCFFKNKGQERYQQESQSRSGLRDINIFIEEQGIIF